MSLKLQINALGKQAFINLHIIIFSKSSVHVCISNLIRNEIVMVLTFLLCSSNMICFLVSGYISPYLTKDNVKYRLIGGRLKSYSGCKLQFSSLILHSG